MFNTEQPAYRDFRNIVSENTTPIVAWVGSGLSVAAGLPTWVSLRDVLCQELANKAATFDEDAKTSLLQRCAVAKKHENLWVSFEILKEALGEASFISAVRMALNHPAEANVPEVYCRLWKMRLSGVLNLNLDRLATKAYSVVHSAGAPSEFCGRECRDFTHLLQSTSPFVANLHGITDQASSWVLTQSDLKTLWSDTGYRYFIQACLASRIVLFVGINVSDVAAGGMLMRLKELGIAPGKHFWITPRRDLATDQYAESAGIRVIRYSAEGGDHSELSEAIDDLVTYVSKDEIAPPVKPTITSACALALLPEAELCQKPAEDIRLMLNARAAQILNGPREQTEKEYDDFCKNYSEAIHRAWYLDDVPPKNILFGNKIIEAVAAGAFARVYRAEAADGEQIAIKVLRGEIRDKREMLQAFRRGVRSMQILSDRKVNGMVAYRETSEIPACVVMDFIEGPNLKDAVDSKLITEWNLVLRVALDLASIIRSAHLLPERVLHRDIRPANIMLKDFYTQAAHWEVVVLDFDLSWHREAIGLSVDTTKSWSGYLAPEQIERSSSVSTRNALVDSFGLGMTLYFLRSGHEPMFAQHRHQDWPDQLNSRIASYPCTTWRSIPARYSRVIKNATRDKQNERWDMSQIAGELTRLDQALRNPSTVESAELLCEELVARSSLAGMYIWEEDENTARLTLETGVSVSVTGDETARAVKIAMSWTDDGSHNRRNVGRWIPKACNKANSALKRVGWHSEVLAGTAKHSHVAAQIPVGPLRRNLVVSAEALSQAVAAMQID